MTTDLQSLARRAVACRHWRWMPGMRWVTDDDSGRCDDWQPEGMAIPAGALPDLSDPATVGCLLALVRKAWGGGVIVCPQHFSGKWVIDLPNGEVFCQMTETEALVAALEAAP